MNEEQIYNTAALLEHLGYTEEQLIEELVALSIKQDLANAIKGSKNDN